MHESPSLITCFVYGIQVRLFHWLHTLSAMLRAGGLGNPVQTAPHPNKIVDGLRDAISAHEHLYTWHSNTTVIAQFLHECLGIHNLRDLRYTTGAEVGSAEKSVV